MSISNLDIVAGDKSLAVNWTIDAPNITTVQWIASGSSTWSSVTLPAGQTSFNITGLIDNKSYTVKVWTTFNVQGTGKPAVNTLPPINLEPPVID
jgi:hypothetical protein